MNGSAIPPLVPPSSDFKDRRTGLIVFGILEIGLGALAALMIPLMLLGQSMAARTNQEAMSPRQLIPGLVSYAVIAAALISVGIGSCKTRRWARALSLVLAWSWLALGVVTIAMMAFFLPGTLKTSQPGGQQMPEAAMLVGMIVVMVFMCILMIVVPGVLVLFYRSPHVLVTCQARNPSPSWTDACPLPVLGMSVWLGFAAIGSLAMPLSSHGVLPVFGRILSGLGRSLCCAILGLLWGYCAWAVYRLRPAGWWIVLISLCIISVSAWITFSQIDLPELYRAMGYSERQIDTMKQFSFLQSHRMAYWSVAGVVPMLGFLLFVKRYFRSPA
jgi:hypothetical protein